MRGRRPARRSPHASGAAGVRTPEPCAPSARTLGEPGSPSPLARVAFRGSARGPGCRGLFCSRRAPTAPRSASCGQRRPMAAAQAQRMAAAAAQRFAQGRPGVLMGAARRLRAPAQRRRGRGGRLAAGTCLCGCAGRGGRTGRQMARTRRPDGSCPRRSPVCGFPSRAQCPRCPRRRQINPPSSPARGLQGEGSHGDPSAGSQPALGVDRSGTPLTTRRWLPPPQTLPRALEQPAPPSQEADSPWEPLTRIRPAPHGAKLLAPHSHPFRAGRGAQGGDLWALPPTPQAGSARCAGPAVPQGEAGPGKQGADPPALALFSLDAL